MEDAVLYVVQKAFIKKDDSVLVLNDPVEGLDFPGGKMKEGEDDLSESLKREVREETSLEILINSPWVTWTESFPESHEFFGHRAILIGYDCEYVSGDVRISEEHDSFKWVTKETCHEVDDGTSYFSVLKKYFENRNHL